MVQDRDIVTVLLNGTIVNDLDTVTKVTLSLLPL